MIPKIAVALKQIASKYRMSFRWKIAVPFLLLGLWLFIGGALIVSNIVFQNANERFNNQLIEGGKISAEWMVQEEANQLEALRSISYTTGVSEAVKAGDAERLRTLAFALALNKQLEAVEFLDLDGRLILSMRHQPGTAIENYTFVRDGDAAFSSFEFVHSALQGWVDRRGDKYAGLVQETRESYFYVAGPIYDAQEHPVGGVLVGITLKTLVTHLRDQTFAHISLYQPDGAAVASSFVEKKPLERDQAVLLVGSQKPISYTRTVRNLETDFVEFINPWNARSQNLGLLGVSFARPAFINPSIPTRIGMFVFIFAVFVFILAIGLLIANYLTRPLVDLTRASQEVSRGNLKVQVPSPIMNDELTDLAHTFNGMVVSLAQSKSEILDAYDNTLVGWALALEMREKSTAMHDQRVAEMAILLAQELGLPDEDLVNIRRGALLHDIGKMGIPDAILNKPGPLTNEEFNVMKRHPTNAWDLLSQIDYLRPALLIPYYHHEKWDGTGYPLGLAGEDIPLPVRVFSIVDVWDAIITDRVYRKAMTYEESLQIIRQGRGTHFDPKVVDAFEKILPVISSVNTILPEDPAGGSQ
jgi:putative nucleotidyltransferase with HDIG domain